MFETDGVTLETDGVTVETDGVTVETDGVTLETDGVMLETDGVTLETDGVTLEVGCENVEPKALCSFVILERSNGKSPVSLKAFIAFDATKPIQIEI